jgi:hypothetical protein
VFLSRFEPFDRRRHYPHQNHGKRFSREEACGVGEHLEGLSGEGKNSKVRVHYREGEASLERIKNETVEASRTLILYL